MATTTIIVEVLIAGIVADLWLAQLFWRLSGGEIPGGLLTTVSSHGEASVVVGLALTYILGWLVNWASEALLHPTFQKKHKKTFFSDKPVNYSFALRYVLTHERAGELVARYLTDIHVIRIARSSVLNFFCLTVTTLAVSHATAACFPLVLMISSFLLWRYRYRLMYGRVFEDYKFLSSPPLAGSTTPTASESGDANVIQAREAIPPSS